MYESSSDNIVDIVCDDGVEAQNQILLWDPPRLVLSPYVVHGEYPKETKKYDMKDFFIIIILHNMSVLSEIPWIPRNCKFTI